ncbi:MAG: NAD(P)-binding domain-containing protein, partial [Pseudomonadota bacterium]|nr:NAD(P)-binding domain-containing protein [Pseudomonadota bacterium]
MTTSLLLIGAGKMGGAMLTGWLADGAAPGGVTVVEPDSATREAWADRPEVVCHANVDDVAETYRP